MWEEFTHNKPGRKLKMDKISLKVKKEVKPEKEKGLRRGK